MGGRIVSGEGWEVRFAQRNLIEYRDRGRRVSVYCEPMVAESREIVVGDFAERPEWTSERVVLDRITRALAWQGWRLIFGDSS